MKLFIVLIMLIYSICLSASVDRIIVKDDNDNKIKLTFSSYINSNGVFEVRVDAGGIPRFMDKLNPTLAFGRDLDDDHIIDTWFFISENGIEVEQMQGQDSIGRDVLPSLLLKKHRSSAKIYFTSVTNSILGFLLISANEANKLEFQYIRDWIDLEEIRIRFEREIASPKSSITREKMQLHYEILSLGFKNLANNMENFAKKDFWGWASADVALWMSGSVIFKWAGAFLIRTGIVITETALFSAVKEEVNTLLGKHVIALKEKIGLFATKLERIRSKGKLIKNETFFQLTKFNLHSAMVITITSDIAKNRLMKVTTLAMKWPLKIVQGAASEWKYIVLNSGIQVSAEAYARWDDIYDPNPLTMTKNLLTNPDVLQNIEYMTADTILMTGVSKSLKTTKARYLASGFIGLTDSSIINLVVKQEDNYKRIAMDTAWESIVGNAQVQIDLKALETFEKMAQKNKNPKLKLIGYAINLVNQGVGYVLYSKATTYVEKPKSNEEIQIKLIPILAEKY